MKALRSRAAPQSSTSALCVGAKGLVPARNAGGAAPPPGTREGGVRGGLCWSLGGTQKPGAATCASSALRPCETLTRLQERQQPERRVAGQPRRSGAPAGQESQSLTQTEVCSRGVISKAQPPPFSWVCLWWLFWEAEVLGYPSDGDGSGSSGGNLRGWHLRSVDAFPEVLTSSSALVTTTFCHSLVCPEAFCEQIPFSCEILAPGTC